MLPITTKADAAREATRNAAQLVASWRVRQAAPLLQQALALDPDLGIARAIYAMYAPNVSEDVRKKEAERAVADAAHGSTAELLVALAARAAINDRLDELTAVSDAAEKLAPGDPFVAFLDVTSRLRPGYEAEVIPVAQGILERRPDMGAVLGLLAYAEFVTGKRDEGLAAARHYLEIAPNEPFAHDVNGELAWRSGQLDEAARQYEKALEVDPTWVSAHSSLVNVEYLRHDYAAARRHAEAGLAASTDFDGRIDAQRMLSLVVAFQANSDALRKVYADRLAEVVKAGRTEYVPTLHFGLATLLAASGDTKAALAEVAGQHMPADNPSPTPVLLYTTLGRAADAHREADALLAAGPDEGYAHEVRTLARTATAIVDGKLDDANASLANLKDRYMRIEAQALILRAARKAGRADLASAAEKELKDFKELEFSAAFAHRLVGLP